MARDASKHLVLLIDEHRVIAGAPGDAGPVTIDLPGRWSDQKPQALGELLKSGLGDARLALGRAIVGVPVSWVLTQHLTVPSTDPVVTAGAVRMRVNRDYATDAGDLVADYTATRGDAGNDVLIGVTTRSKLRRLTEALSHAGLRTEAVYITAQAFADSDPADATVVRVHPPMLELALVRHGKTIGLRSLCETLNDGDPAGAARTIAFSISSDPQLSAMPGRMVLAADAATGVDPRAIVAQLNGVTNGAATVIDGSAIEALRRRAGDDDLLDLMRCRASQTAGTFWTPTRKLGAAIAAVVLVVLLAVGGLWWMRAHRLSSLQAIELQMRPQAESLGAVKQRLDASAPWFDKRMDMLSCMLTLTECVPQRGEMWLAEFRLNGDHTGSLQGRTGSRGVMLEFLRALQASEHLTEVALRDSSESQGDEREVRFEITFRFTNVGGAR
jgi:hypothetical protein